MRIAIVGAGVSGLTAAYLLQRQHEITVFEAEPRLGGHSHTVPFQWAGETQHLDTGFIVFNDRNYPAFERLLAQLGVPSQPSDMSFGVSDDRSFAYASHSLRGVFAARRTAVNPRFVRMLAEVPRFQRAARRLLASGDEQVSLRAWLQRHDFSSFFIERLLVPQAAAVWSADPRQMWSFPALFLARFFDNHGMLSLSGRPRWRTIVGGSERYVEALSAGFRDRVRLATPVRSIARGAHGVTLTVEGDAEPLTFDQVVIAAHADQALEMLADATWREREILGAIPYQENEAILHTDTSILPAQRAAWASWNYHLLDRPSGRTTVTYHLNRLQQLGSEQEFCVTLNLGERIDPERVIKRIAYAHPVYTPAGLQAQRRFEEISGLEGRTHFCGAYWSWGFHEDGVQSALRVGECFGAQL
ncbi:MAG TPA: FAD-dependent oxidoreductase [Solirubrobacteraceae bacterium]|nr:FAD-dependent oxidoreductase [Solirubrobacteraceae bacterium]